MKKILSLLGTAVLAASILLPAAPASAQSFSFGFGVGAGPGFYSGFGYRPYPNYRPYRPYYRSYYRPRVFLDVDVGSSGHVARCEARYRSYDADTDMYLGYDGDYHYCRL